MGADHDESGEVLKISRLDVERQLNNRKKFVTSFIAGAIAGSIAKTTIAPLDRGKIVFQTSEKRYTLRALIRFLRDSAANDGLRSLWRGNTATMARIVPYASVQFSSHEQYKRLLRVDTAPSHKNGKAGPAEADRSEHARRFLAGSLAGVTSVACTYPLDLVRARMAVTKKLKYHSIVHALRQILATEGYRTLFQGFTPTMLGAIPYSGTSFFTYETLKKLHKEVTGRADPSPPERMFCGAVAGLLGQTASYPLDIVRRRMQTAGVTGHPEYTKGILTTMRLVLRTEGLTHGLYKGLSVNWVKGPIAVGVSFTTFDYAQRHLRQLPWLHDENT